MRKLIVFGIVGVLSSIGYASAATTAQVPSPTPTKVPVIKYSCELEGQGFGQGSNQDEDVRCWVRGEIGITSTENANLMSTAVPDGSPIRIRCTNGFRLEAQDSAINFHDGSLWINASARDKTATLRVKNFVALESENHGNRFRSLLIASNSAVTTADGSCKFDFPAPVPVPAN